MLRLATIIEDRTVANEAGLNRTVEAYFIDEDESESYEVVTPVRSETTEGHISIESSLGRALLGHKADDCVQVSLPQGGYEAEIRSIAKDHSDNAISSF